jgi:hypothetical protein
MKLIAKKNPVFYLRHRHITHHNSNTIRASIVKEKNFFAESFSHRFYYIRSTVTNLLKKIKFFIISIYCYYLKISLT